MSGLGRLLGQVWRYRGRVLLAFVAMLLTAALQLVYPFMTERLVDLDLGGDSFGLAETGWLALLPIPAAIVLLFLFKGVTSYFGKYLMHWVGERVVRDMRDQLVERTLGQSLDYFSEHSTGQIISRVVSDVERVHLLVTEKLYDLVSAPLQMVFLMGFCLYMDWQLALITFVAVPVVVYPVGRLARKLRRVSSESQERMATVASLVHEIVRGIRVVKAFAMEPFELSRFQEATRRLFAVNMRAVRVVAITPPLMELFAGGGIALALIYSRSAVMSGSMSKGEVTAFFTALLLLYQPFKRISRVVGALEQALAAATRVWQVLDAPVSVRSRSGARKLERVKGEIVFDDVSFRYQDRWVLRNISLRVAAGEVVALVGPSGAGKSTLANLVLRFYDPSEGRVLLDAEDLREFDVRSLREQIGLVTQDVVVFNDSVRNNIAYGRGDLPLERVEQAARAANAHDFIEQLPQGYDTLVGEAGVRLSGGERQRLAIARALIKNAPVLVLDEATSSLDAESEELVRQALENLMRDRTTIVIAHRLSTVRNADRIVVLEAGRVLETGSHAELLRSEGLYARLVDLQARGVIAP